MCELPHAALGIGLEYFRSIPVGDVLLGVKKCFVSDAGVCNLVSGRLEVACSEDQGSCKTVLDR